MEANQLDGPETGTETGTESGTGPAPAGTPTRRARLRRAAAARGVPLPTILVTVAVLALTYLAAKLAYRLRDVLLLLMVAGFIALILNPFVVFVQRRIPRRGPAVAIVTIWATLYFGAFVAALLSIPAAAALQVVVREIWRATAPGAEPSQTS